MTQKLEIGIDAKLNTQAVDQGVDGLNEKLNQASKTKLDPVSDQAIKKVNALGRGVEGVKKAAGAAGKTKFDPIPDSAVKKADALWQAYLKMDREMARRLKYTGQEGVAPDKINWESVYQNKNSRARKREQLQAYMRNGGVDDFRSGSHGGGGGDIKNMATGVVQAGLRATGPAGGVAANALGTGMTSGFGAGLKGFAGGMAALAVGKMVGAVADKAEKAADNSIAFDRLKRTLGDVNVSFGVLKTAVMKSGETMNITYDETAGLFSQFSKLGNLSGRQDMQSLPEEIGLGVGLSKSYGLENGQGVGLLGQMRGVGVTKDVQDSRRLALLIGETIAKSEAFAKADEVFEAISNFANAQTRQSLAAANIADYAGMFSSMTSSGIAGMDPAGSAAMLARMNSSLAAGGAHGEASQFFTSMVGNRMGLDPLQMQVLREGGAFATKDQMFGMSDNGTPSAYMRYMGQTGPTGSDTFLSQTRALIEEKYSGDSERDKLMRAQAFGNHTGLNMNQAMAMLSLQPNEMGELQKVLGGKAMSLNASGINNAAMALNGTDEQRESIRTGLLKREDLTRDDRNTLENLSSQTPEDQKRTLAVLSAQYEQERTQGTDIRDSRAALDNIKTKIAYYLVPAVTDMRKIMANMASGGKKTAAGLMKEINAAENEERVSDVKEQYRSEEKGLKSERDNLISEKSGLNWKRMFGVMSSEDVNKRRAEIDKRLGEINGELGAVGQKRDAAVKELQTPEKTSSAPGNPGNPSEKPKANVAEFVKKYGPLAENIAKEKNVPVDAVLGQLGLETGWGKSIIPGTNNLGNIKDFSGKGPKAKDNMTGSVDAYRSYDTPEAFGEDFKKLLDKKRYSGVQGTDNARDYFSALKKGGYAEDPNYVNSGVAAAAMAAKARASAAKDGAAKPAINPGRGSADSYKDLRLDKKPGDAPVAGAKVPDDAAGGDKTPYRTPIPETKTGEAPGRNAPGTPGAAAPISIQAAPMTITVQHQDAAGRAVRPPEQMQTRVAAANPNTYAAKS